MTNRLVLSLLTAAVASAILAASAAASCMPTTPAAQRVQATVIFDGLALEGPTGTGIQHFKVTRYLKGHGPQTVRVHTGYIKHADGSGTITSVSLIVQRGERWRIFGQEAAGKVIRTNQCAGSRKT